jgi:hypothetical protein
MSTRELIKKQIHDGAVGASDKLDALRQKLAHCDDPEQRRILALKISAAAEERDNLLQALFATPRTL